MNSCPKMKILSLIIHPHVIPNLMSFLLWQIITFWAQKWQNKFQCGFPNFFVGELFFSKGAFRSHLSQKLLF